MGLSLTSEGVSKNTPDCLFDMRMTQPKTSPFLRKPDSSSSSWDTQNNFKNINREPGWGCKHCTFGLSRNPPLWRLLGNAWRNGSCVCRRSSVVVRRPDCELGHMNSHPMLLQNTDMTWSVPLFLSVSVKRNELYFPCPGPESHMW